MTRKKLADSFEVNSIRPEIEPIYDTEESRAFTQLSKEYLQATGKPMPCAIPQDYGYQQISYEDLFKYAKAAIASGKPINWRKILGKPACEINPNIVS